MTSGDLAGILGGTLDGSEEILIRGVADPARATGGDVVFCLSKAQRDGIVQSGAAVVVCDPHLQGDFGRPVIRVENPRLAMARTIAHLYPAERPRPGIAQSALVDPTAKIGRDVTVFGGAWVGPDAEIGDETVLYPGVVVMAGVRIGVRNTIFPNVTLREGTVLGDRVILHPGVVIGADGFGYAQNGMRIEKIPQVGIVRIGDDVEIGANTAIDRATLGETVIGAGTKIDNLVQIGHNVTVGRGCIIVAQTGIAGSAIIEDGVILGGQVGVADHIRIGAGAKVASQSGLAKDVPAGEVWSGSPALPHRRWLRSSKLFGDLPEFAARLGALEKKFAGFSGNNDEEAQS